MTMLSRTETRKCPDSQESKLRVMLLLDLKEGAQQQFLKVYEKLRHQVAGVQGHISDQLCQSIEDPCQWLITSEWEDASSFLAWVGSAEHKRMVQPMHECVGDTRSLRFAVLRETFSAGQSSSLADDDARGRRAAESSERGPVPDADGVVRHALTFTVKPGSEQAVAEILAGYASPQAEVDSTTRLRRTSVFKRGNRVVRMIEVVGDLGAALRHVAAQPGVRAAEEALNPHLEEARDLNNPQSAKAFFARAALPAVHHLSTGGTKKAKVQRRALLYPVRPGCAHEAALLLAEQDRLAIARTPAPLVASTIFVRDDVVVRAVDLPVRSAAEPALVLGINDRRARTALARLVHTNQDADLDSEAGIKRFLAECEMDQVTDRQTPGA